LHLQIPAINLDAGLVSVGLNHDGTMEVPEPDYPGWYTGSPTPGEIGPSVITGHVDSIHGAAIFYSLKQLQPGDTIRISRQDNSTVTFKVERLETYSQDAFPTKAVYGNIDYPGLRLITCDGDFNPFTRHYSHNLVVYARAGL
jgi:LPXTG-site transpeptidase (sortase) family protein